MPNPRASEGASFVLGPNLSLYIGPGPVKGSAPVLALSDRDGQHVLANFHNSATAERLIGVFVSLAGQAAESMMVDGEPTPERNPS